MNFSDLFRTKSIEKIFEDAKFNDESGIKLKKNLGVRDLTALGIAAIVGAGIFSTIGTAASTGGPAIVLLFIFTAIACSFSALCYARFSSKVPVSGSAYTYSYIAMGELVAWIIGWDLIMEYSVGNIAVAISWSGYFTSLMEGMGIYIPHYLTIDYFTAKNGYIEVMSKIHSGVPFYNISDSVKDAYYVYISAPIINNFRLICNIPAFCITALITTLVYVGIKESKNTANIMVLIKLIILMVFITIGAFYVNPHNWSPFAPNGFAGVLKGVSGVFFAYIGFDAISTTAEECKNPKKDLPRGIILSMLICTALYVIVSLILTGMVKYSDLGRSDPLAYVFQVKHLEKLSGIIAFSAIIAMTSVLLVFQIGQPRIWMSMSRDGLLPKIFSKIHPKFKTPSFSTILTGILVAVPSLFLNINLVTDLTSIGTLFAFILVCGGVLIIDNKNQVTDSKEFNIYYLNCRFYLIPIWTLVILGFYFVNINSNFSLINLDKMFWYNKIPILFFICFALFITVLSVIKQYSLIPVLGLLINLYLMTELGITNWLRFVIWLIIGLFIYFIYSKKHSFLNEKRF